jgi:hypothetical protein
MEAREVPAALVGNGIALPSYNTGGDTAVELVNPATGATLTRAFPGFHGAIVAAAGDVNGDGVTDAIVGVQNLNGLIEVVDGRSGDILGATFAFPGYTGKINVGTADLRGDGIADIVVTADAPNIPVRVIDFQDGLSLGFNAFPGVNGLSAVTGADLTGSGQDQIVVGVGGQGLGGRVGVFSPFGARLLPGIPVFPGFNGGISLAAGDLTGAGHDEIVVGGGTGSPGGEVKVLSTDGLQADFFAFAPSVTNGVNVHVADGDGDGKLDIFVSLQGGGSPILTGFRGASGQLLAATGFGGGGDGTYSGYDNTSGNYNDGSNYYYNNPGYTPPDSGSTPPAPSYDPGSSSSPPDDSSSYDTSSSDCGCDYSYPTDDGSDYSSDF